MGIALNNTYKSVIFWSLLALCLATALIVNLYMGVDTVYTHIFYIPVILAGLWYYRKAIYVALFLGGVHIIMNLYVSTAAIPSSLVRAAVLVLVALVVGTLSEEKDRLNQRLSGSVNDLSDSNGKLSSIIEFYPEATLIIDNDGKVIAWNRAMEELTGVKAESMISKGDYEYSLPFYGERKPMLVGLLGSKLEDIRAVYKDASFRGSTIEARVDKVVLKGKEAILWTSATKLYGADGKPIGAAESIRDVTDMTHMREELVASEGKFRSLVEASHDLIFIVDGNLCVTYLNHMTAESHGCKPEDLIGKGIRELFKGSDPEIQKRHLEMAFESAKPISYEDKAVLFNRESWVLTQLVPLKDPDGEISAVMGVSRDITGRKMVEQALLLQNNDLEIVNSIISAINSAKNIDQMLDEILERVLVLLDMDEGAIYLHEEDGASGLRLQSYVARGDPAHMPTPLAMISPSYTSEKFFQVQDHCSDIFAEAHANACVPIILKGKIIGIIAFYSTVEKSIKVQPKLLTGLISQLAIAIENHRLFKRISHTSAYLADIINESPDAMITVDGDGTISSFNKSASRMLHYTQGEILGKDIAILLPLGDSLELTESKSFVRDFLSSKGEIIQLNISMARIYKGAANSSYIITLKNLSEISGLKITPSMENALETKQLYHFEPGIMYLVDKETNKDYMDVFADQVKHNIQGLYVTRQSPKKVRELHGLEKTPIIWLNASEYAGDENCIKPDNLSGLGATLGKFMAEANDGLILLDGTEYLMTRNGFDSLLKFVHFLNDRLMQSRCRIFFCIDRLALDDRQLHLLLSEMSKFKEKEQEK